jgi:hypothetical protein
MKIESQVREISSFQHLGCWQTRWGFISDITDFSWFAFTGYSANISIEALRWSLVRKAFEDNMRCHIIIDNSSMHYPKLKAIKILKIKLVLVSAVLMNFLKQRDAIGLSVFQTVSTIHLKKVVIGTIEWF